MMLDDLLRDLAHQIATALVALAVYVGMDLWRLWRSRSAHAPTRYELDAISHRDKRIYVLLAELGTKLGADRAYLTRYANGEQYADGTDMFRKQRTHEWVRVGVSHYWDPQDGDVSRMPEEIRLVLDNGPSFTVVSAMDDGPFKRLMNAMQIRAVGRCAVKKGVRVVAFVGVDFLHREREPENMHELVLYANRIEQVMFSTPTKLS